MPATSQKPAHTSLIGESKRQPICLRGRQLLTATFCDAVIAVIDFLDEISLDKLAQSHRRILPSDPEIFRDDHRRLNRQYFCVVHSLEDAVVSSRHPLRQIPDFHELAAVRHICGYGYAYVCYAVASIDAFVNRFNTLPARYCSNDWPGASGRKSIRAERDHAPTRLVVTTTMSKNDASGDKPRSWDVDKDRPLDDVIAEIAPFATGGEFDARFSLSGEHDDATVRQAVEVDDD